MNNLFSYVILLVTSCFVSTAQAQTPVYFFYDPGCMQQLVYEKSGLISELAHTDYVASTADEQVILRVQNDPAQLNRKMLLELPNRPVLCGDPNYLSPALMKDINNKRRMAYVAVQVGQQYAVYNIHSVATLKANKKGITYTDPVYGFVYQTGISKIGEILNRGNNKERNVFFEKQRKTACFPTYEFKVVSRHAETPIKHFHFVNAIGMTRWYTPEGTVQLSSINGVPFGQILAQRCNQMPVADATTPEVPKVVPDTIGMTPVEKKLWMMRHSEGSVVTTPIQRPVTPVNQDPNGGTTPPSMSDPNVPPKSTDASLLPGGIYIVQEKDNLYALSERFGISIERLVELNGLQTYELGMNQPLKVVDDGSVPHQDRNPQVVVDQAAQTKTTIHLVEQGQTLYSIAKRYGITLKDIYALNRSLTNDQIDINQRIVVGYQQLKK